MREILWRCSCEHVPADSVSVPLFRSVGPEERFRLMRLLASVLPTPVSALSPWGEIRPNLPLEALEFHRRLRSEPAISLAGFLVDGGIKMQVPVVAVRPIKVPGPLPDFQDQDAVLSGFAGNR